MPLRNIFVTTVIETRRPMFKIVCGTIKMTDHLTNDQAQIKKPKKLRHFCYLFILFILANPSVAR